MAQPLKTVLLATDGGADARLAARAAGDLAVLAKAELHVVYAWMLGPRTMYPYLNVTSDFPDIYEQQARAELTEAAKEITAHGVNVAKEHLRMGRAVNEILAVGEEIDADLIVGGSRGHGALGRLVLGSVAEGIVQASDRPVLIVRGGDRAWPPQHVIAGDDGSDEALLAASLAFRIGALLHASTLLVHVIPNAPVTSRSDIDAYAGLQDRARRMVADRAQTLEQMVGFSPQTLVRAGDPATELVAVAEEYDVPLLAVGKRGLGRIARLRLGSVSTKLLHAAAAPVLVGTHQP